MARAKRALLKVRKRNKYGKEYIGQNEVIAGAGMFSAKEAEAELMRAADEADEPVVDAVVETYGSREVPDFEGNPRRSTASHVQWGGFQGAGWLPESPLLRQRGLDA